MENLKPTVMPMVANIDLHSSEDEIGEARKYRHIIGSLQYMTLMHLDIQLTVNRLVPFLFSPKKAIGQQ